MPVDSNVFRHVMGRFASGVTVVTTGGEMGLHGLTASAVASLSLHPPLILVAVGKHSQSLEFIKANRCFAVNILKEGQEHVSAQFAAPGPKSFAGIDFHTEETDAPILDHCLAYAECKLYEVLPGGDHEIFVGEVVAGKVHDGAPLLYYHGGYRRIAE